MRLRYRLLIVSILAGVTLAVAFTPDVESRGAEVVVSEVRQ